MDLIIPGAQQLVTIDFSQAHMSDYMRRLVEEETGISDAARWLLGLECGGKSDYLENKMAEHGTGKASFTMPTSWLALCTVVPEDGKTGSTITEANYTGYERKKVEAVNLGTASGGTIKTSAKLEFAACTAGSSTIVGWATVDAATTGNMLYWGSATSTVISTTQNPATIASEGLAISED